MTTPEPPTYDPTPLATVLLAFVLELLRVPPLKQGLRDILEIYNITGFSSEIIRHESEQIQALAEAMTLFHAGQIKHDRRAIKHQSAVEQILSLAQTIADRMDDPDGAIAKAARDARALIDAAADEQLDLIETNAARARTLLRIAQSTARADLADAVATAQTLRGEADKGSTEAIAPAPTLREAAAETAHAAAETLRAAETTEAAAAAAEQADSGADG